MIDVRLFHFGVLEWYFFNFLDFLLGNKIKVNKKVIQIYKTQKTTAKNIMDNLPHIPTRPYFQMIYHPDGED